MVVLPALSLTIPTNWDALPPSFIVIDDDTAFDAVYPIKALATPLPDPSFPLTEAVDLVLYQPLFPNVPLILIEQVGFSLS